MSLCYQHSPQSSMPTARFIALVIDTYTWLINKPSNREKGPKRMT
jgi:hypothetical protein